MTGVLIRRETFVHRATDIREKDGGRDWNDSATRGGKRQ